MTFKEAVEATPGLGPEAYRPGLQALGSDSDRVRCSDTRRLAGSADIDGALAQRDPRGHRWDYAVAHREADQDRIYWIEIHEASPRGATAVLEKLAWLKAWLAADGDYLHPMTRQYVWISSGKTTLLKSSPTVRRLTQAGVFAAGNHFQIG